MDPKCSACGADAHSCECYPNYSGNGRACDQVTDRYPAAIARPAALPFSAAWTIVVPLNGRAAERIGEGDDEGAAWEDAVDRLREADEEARQIAALDAAGHDQETEHAPCGDQACERCYPAASYVAPAF